MTKKIYRTEVGGARRRGRPRKMGIYRDEVRELVLEGCQRPNKEKMRWNREQRQIKREREREREREIVVI